MKDETHGRLKKHFLLKEGGSDYRNNEKEEKCNISSTEDHFSTFHSL